jgi:hypothetical protein
VLLRWQASRPAPLPATGDAASQASDSEYRARLETDLQQRR